MKIEIYNFDQKSWQEEIPKVFGENSWPAIAIAWTRIWLQPCPDIGYAEVLICRKDLDVVGFAIVYHILRLDLLHYTLPYGERISRGIQRIGLGPFCKHAAYLDLVCTDEPALFVLPRVDETTSQLIRNALLSAATTQKNVQCDAICVRVESGGELEQTATDKGLISFPMFPGTSLALKEESFESYIANRSANRRAQIRNDRRKFQRLGGHVEQMMNPESRADELVQLHNNIRHRKSAEGGPPVPVPMRPMLFRTLQDLPGHSGLVLAANINGELAGYALVLVIDEDRLFIGPIGLNYDLSLPSRTYQNLFYSCIDLAFQRKCKTLFLGSTSYEFKCSLGAIKDPRAFRIKLYTPWLQSVARPLTALMGHMFEA